MGYKEVYQLWKDYPELNADLRAELETMKMCIRDSHQSGL